MLNSEKAPGGAFSAGQHKPAIQGTNRLVEATPVRIARMLRQIFDFERQIRSCEQQTQQPGRRAAMVDGVVKQVAVKELAAQSLQRTLKRRDEHLAQLRHLIDFALTTAAYKDVPCPDCRLPLSVPEFVDQVLVFEEPAIPCERCKDQGVVREKRTDKRSRRRFGRISYFKKVLDDTIACAKIRAGTRDANDAYKKLETENRMLLVKFGNEMQTSLEGDDALQGVRQGLIDAARRFDPTRKEGAMFNTVAYNWCRRNSRARHNGQKRAGVYAPSIEGLGTDEEGNGAAALIASSDGAFGTFAPDEAKDPDLVLDLREKIDGLPDSQRQIVQYEMAGVSTVQISKEMGLTTAKVRKLREFAFESLRSSMSGYVDVVCD
jgi:RNA polymerase sigma factor (sigma-70 family)